MTAALTHSTSTNPSVELPVQPPPNQNDDTCCKLLTKISATALYAVAFLSTATTLAAGFYALIHLSPIAMGVTLIAGVILAVSIVAISIISLCNFIPPHNC